MKNKIVAIQGDNLKKLNYKNDTTIFLAHEAQNQGSKIFYYEPKNIFIKNNQIYADGNFIKLYSKKKFFKLLNKKTIKLENSSYLLVRQDPPFNMNYITTTYFLDRLKTVKIINNPTSIRSISEKLYSYEFKKYMPPTIYTSRIVDIINFIKKNKSTIIKPIHGHSGNDIKFLNGKINKNYLSKYLLKHGYIMCQKFLSGIINGDKRVFIINGKVKGSISRIPKKGSFLSNLSKGGTAITSKLSKKEEKISNLVAKKLKKDGIYFAGIDFISEKLNGDINVTSPTGLKNYFDITGINLAKIFWKEIRR
tara:strand:+ start:2344 stop:3267 length:924 start_codon:yes stop_codon:yes gene_type:complete